MEFTLHDQDEMLQVWKVQRWFEMYNPKILGAEQVVYNFDLVEAGTIDAVVEFPTDGVELKEGRTNVTLSGIYVVDFKTGKSVSDEAYYQLASYRYMYMQQFDVYLNGAIILHTSSSIKKPIEGLKTIVISADECDTNFETHQMISTLWLRKNPDFAPKVFSFPDTLKLETPAVRLEDS